MHEILNMLYLRCWEWRTTIRFGGADVIISEVVGVSGTGGKPPMDAPFQPKTVIMRPEFFLSLPIVQLCQIDGYLSRKPSLVGYFKKKEMYSFSFNEMLKILFSEDFSIRSYQ